LVDQLDPLNPAVTAFSSSSLPAFVQQTGDPVAAQQMVWQNLEGLRQQQASSLGYFDTFWLFAILGFALVLLMPLMKRSVAEKGAHISAE
ncbi:MAG: drug resistance transporter, EmrB/QacA subfamily, partial [Verrucomicrobiaceae bacterium]|nr:drug resistance transporter, EmrB/QacA subfamily [Verrucomicrobiaceae bacterium]